MHVKHLIIGAGPTGLGAAFRLKELGEKDFMILEQHPWVGGLATSFVDQSGFTWDIGGHVQFSHYPYFDRVMDLAIAPGEWLTHERESWVWIKDRLVPYPFQNNIHYLPEDSQLRCLNGILDIALSGTRKQPTNFAEWIVSIFGEGVAEEFMLPYNFKVWAYPPSELAYDWIGERVAVTDLRRVLENLVRKRMDASWGPNNVFRFPRRGGTGAIWQSVARLVGRDRIRSSSSVTEINASNHSIALQSGEELTYDVLLSTIPLDIVATRAKGLASRYKRDARHLKHSTSNIVGVGVEGRPAESLESKCWMYFPESNCPFYRVTLFSKYSPENVPDSSRYFSLMTETSESAKKPVIASTLASDTVAGLKATRLIGGADRVVSVWSYRAEYGYPTPSLERDSILDSVIPALEAFEIYSRGRFGAWKYEVSNQDHSFMQGVEWVDYLLQGKVEETLKIDRPALSETDELELATA